MAPKTKGKKPTKLQIQAVFLGLAGQSASEDETCKTLKISRSTYYRMRRWAERFVAALEAEGLEVRG